MKNKSVHNPINIDNVNEINNPKKNTHTHGLITNHVISQFKTLTIQCSHTMNLSERYRNDYVQVMTRDTPCQNANDYLMSC